MPRTPDQFDRILRKLVHDDKGFTNGPEQFEQFQAQHHELGLILAKLTQRRK